MNWPSPFGIAEYLSNSDVRSPLPEGCRGALNRKAAALLEAMKVEAEDRCVVNALAAFWIPAKPQGICDAGNTTSLAGGCVTVEHSCSPIHMLSFRNFTNT